MKNEWKIKWNNQSAMKLRYYLKNKSEFELKIINYDELVDKMGIDKIKQIIQTPKHIIETVTIIEKDRPKKRGPKPKIKELKIYKSFWDLIVSGQKEFEFRKLEKGLTSGEYIFIDSETNKQLGLVKLNAVELYPKHIHDCQTMPSDPIDNDREFIMSNYYEKHDFVQYQILEVHEF